MRAAARMTGTAPYTEVFDLFVLVATISTSLAARMEGRDFHYRASRPRSFIFQLSEELSPCGIRNTFCQMVVSQHPLHIEVFHADDLVLIHQFGRQLVKHIAAAVRHSFMAASDLDALLFPVCRTFLLMRQPALLPPEFGFHLPQILGIRIFASVAVNCKGLEANIQTNHRVDDGFGFDLNFAEDGYEILSTRRTANRSIANLAFDITAFAVWHPAKTRQLDSLVGNMDGRSFCRRVALVMIMLAFELWETTTVFEKTFVGIVQTAAGVLERLAIRFGKPWQIRLHLREQILHFDIAETLLSAFVCLDSALQHVVIHIPATAKRSVDLFCLLFGRIQAKLDVFFLSVFA